MYIFYSLTGWIKTSTYPQGKILMWTCYDGGSWRTNGSNETTKALSPGSASKVKVRKYFCKFSVLGKLVILRGNCSMLKHVCKTSQCSQLKQLADSTRFHGYGWEIKSNVPRFPSSWHSGCQWNTHAWLAGRVSIYDLRNWILCYCVHSLVQRLTPGWRRRKGGQSQPPPGCSCGGYDLEINSSEWFLLL